MVKCGLRRVLGAALMLSLVSALSAKELAELRMGDVVETEIYTPVGLRIHDPKAIEELTAEAIKQVPAIFQFNPDAAAEVEAQLQFEISTLRTNFVAAMAGALGSPRIESEALATERFRTFFTSFTNQHREFPHLAEIAPLWAVGKPDGDYFEAVAPVLRDAMAPPILPEFKAMPLGSQIRIVTNNNAGAPLLATDLEKGGAVVATSSVLTLADARAAFQQNFISPEPGGAKFLASLLKPNCILETDWTRQARARFVDAHLSVVKYEEGDKLATPGQLVDAKLLAALAQLQALIAAAPVAAPDPTTPAPASTPQADTQSVAQVLAQEIQAADAATPVAAPDVPATQTAFNPWWLVVVPGVVLATWLATRRKHRGILLPARVAGNGERAAVLECPTCHEEIIIPASTIRALVKVGEDWEQRALVAEHRVHRTQEAIRSGVFKQFALWLKSRFVKELIVDRSNLLDSQRAATAEMEELERRLDELHAPLQDRLQAYERRVADLEKSLAQKDSQSRELIKAKIQVTRQHLEAERSRGRMEMN